MKKNLTKIALIAMSVVILGLSIAVGTLAYLHDDTDSITNTFTVGANVAITLTENSGETYKIMPGEKAAKNPMITVGENSDDCWVFVKVVKSEKLDEYVAYAMADGWTAVKTTDGSLVYGLATSQTKKTSLQVLKGEGDGDYKNGVVTFKNVDAVDGDDQTLTFTGYAIQAAGFADMNAAYDALQDSYVDHLSERDTTSSGT